MSAKPFFKLFGNAANPPKEWTGIQILATFDQTGGQANISTERFKFVNENAKAIRDYIAGGAATNPSTVGIFEGIPFEFDIQNSSSYPAFRGFLDLNGFRENTPVDVDVNIKREDGLNSLADRASGLSYRYLESVGAIGQQDYIDMPYVREKLAGDQVAELAVLSLNIFLMQQQLADIIKEFGKDASNTTAHTIGGGTGPVAGATHATLTTILNVIYAALVIIYLTQLIIDLIELIFPPVRRWRGTVWKTLLERAMDYLNYQYQSSIPELASTIYLPSKSKQGRLNILPSSPSAKGIPDAVDFGFSVSEQIEMVNRAFSARVAIIGNTVHHEPLINDNFWLNQSPYTIPDVENEVKLYNTTDLKGRRLVSFETDISDLWTIENFIGTNYEIVTQPITINNKKHVLIKGFEDTRIPMALPTRKDQLSPVETVLAVLAAIVDGVINFFGGNSNFAGQILSRVGIMKVTGEEIQTGKLIPFQQGGFYDINIPANHRQIWSAKYLWNTYVSNDSFVLHNYRGQKWQFEELRIPFGFEDFLQVINNSYCITQAGEPAKIERLAWEFDSDYALISGWVRKPYTRNLEEFTHEGGTDDV